IHRIRHADFGLQRTEGQARGSCQSEAAFWRESRANHHSRTADGGTAKSRRHSRQVRRARERPERRTARRTQRAAEAVRVLPRQAAHLRGGARVSEGLPLSYEPIAMSAESTVVAEFQPEPDSSSAY